MKSFKSTRCKITCLSLFMLCLGLALVVIGQMLLDTEVIGVNVGSVLNNMGTFVSVIVVLQFVFDYYVREEYFDEISSTIIRSSNIRDSGLTDFYSDSKEIKYNDLIKDSREIEIFLHHSSRIIKDYKDEWEERFRDKKAANFYYIKEDGEAFKYLVSSGEDEGSIRSTLKEAKAMICAIDSSKNLFQFFEHDHVLSYNIFRFDNEVFMILNTAVKQKSRVPALKLKLGSSLDRFSSKDMEGLKSNATKI